MTANQPINLLLGWPTPALHPDRGLLSAATAVLASNETSTPALRYGPQLGGDGLRKGVAAWLTDLYHPTAGDVTANRVGITGGASVNLTNILLRFSDPVYTRSVWMIEPTYFMACPMIEDAGLTGKLRGVPEDEEGLDIVFLRDALSKADAEAVSDEKPIKNYPKLFRHIIYAVPTFSNPSGKIMSLRRREELVRLAREYDALVIADDVYDALRWPAQEDVSLDKLGRSPPRIVDIDRALPGQSEWGNSVSNGSFSKIVAPGMRVGWLEGTPQFVDHMGKVGSSSSGGCIGHFSSSLISHMVTTGELTRHIENVLIPTYRKRYNATVGAITKYLVPLGVTLNAGSSYRSSEDAPSIAGGYFLYITFPDGFPTADALATWAKTSQALTIAPGSIFTVRGDEGSDQRSRTTFGRGARLSWAWNDENIIVEGIQRLAVVVQDALDGKVQQNEGGEQSFLAAMARIDIATTA
ncbi:pyridoxal phosphate-dependent transferase [Dactylonectria macrodidyma]|uniref:Pyridoxal phosphate-dependent transferase n=1 Tax=Dactylonectria macrodidyma TaxID=307937 RepID=A0A9P9FS77_9HYPO|nr:pyridoxal phosphate-dependent transferase [Dactylonectria macrodidyma]